MGLMDDNMQHEQFIRLFLEVQPRIYSYLRTMIFNRADAEDVLQNVAGVLWKKFDEYQPGTRFDHWAFAAANNQVKAYFLKRRRDRLVFSDNVMALIADKAIAESTTLNEFQDGLQECLEKLSEQDRQMVHLCFEPQATNRAVAVAVGRSETAVSRALHRIYAVLLACVQRRVDSAKQEGSI
jgi:RNA polymerase sigma-70 factor, ECF subfamily